MVGRGVSAEAEGAGLRADDGRDGRPGRQGLAGGDGAQKRSQAEWQYPRYKPVGPGLQARILRMFGQPYDKSAIDPKEAYYLNGWDDDDDVEGDEAPLQVKPARNLFSPQRSGSGQTAKPWALNWGKSGNMFGAKPQTSGYHKGKKIPGP